MAGGGKLVFKSVDPAEFDRLAPLILRREVLDRPPKASALYHTSLISPLCWALSPVRRPGTVWMVMPNLVVPTSEALDRICDGRGGQGKTSLFDIKGKRNNGPIRSGLWQSWFGRRQDWEYGLETQYPGGFAFDSKDDRGRVLRTLDLDLQALSSQDLCDYSLMVAVYGCEGDTKGTTFPKGTSNAYDFPVRTVDGRRLRVSLALIDFGMTYASIPWIERWVGAKGWSAEDYGSKLKAYVADSLFARAS
mmetsp:Transcript_102650/g.306564  ORF Transcript_102650/g.306564 Transcript_102650/m.306564 type:complete len:249 (-) Transcript_102650:33-779(-)